MKIVFDISLAVFVLGFVLGFVILWIAERTEK